MDFTAIMPHRTRIALGAVAIAACLFGPTDSQAQIAAPAQQVALGYGQPTAAPQSSWVYTLFDEKSHDFGNVARGADVKHRLKVTNPFEETIHVVSIGKTCGCTNAAAAFETLKTHEEGYINVAMDTVKFLGEKKSNVLATFRFDGGATATAQIPIRSFIRSDVVVQPGAADFGTVDLGVGSVKTLQIDYAGRGDWKIQDFQQTNPYINVEIAEQQRTARGVRYQMQVSLKPDAPIGVVRDRIVLTTNDNGNSTVPVLVEAKVEPDIVVSPARVPLGILQPGQEKTVNVVVRGKKPFVISEVVCDAADCFAVRLGEQARPVHVVPLTVKTPTDTGELSERFEVTIAGRNEPVIFEAYGTVTN